MIHQRKRERQRLAVFVLVVGSAACVSQDPTPEYGVIQPAVDGLYQDFDANDVTTRAAILASLRELGYEPDGEADGTRFAAGSLVVELESFAPDFTRVQVIARRQTEDDRVRAREILEKLGKRLETRYRRGD